MTPPPQSPLSEPQSPSKRQEELEDRKKNKPGPAPDALKLRCQEVAKEIKEKVVSLADEFEVSQELVARLCGLKDKESRARNQWNVWEEKWYDENEKAIGGE